MTDEIKEGAEAIMGDDDIFNEENYEFYVGLGAKFNSFDGLVIPVGLNIFPFSSKNFGFHIELSPIILGDNELLRGSWGIRYRFLSRQIDN